MLVNFLLNVLIGVMMSCAGDGGASGKVSSVGVECEAPGVASAASRLLLCLQPGRQSLAPDKRGSGAGLGAGWGGAGWGEVAGEVLPGRPGLRAVINVFFV